MITSLRLVNFKNFADETLRVGQLTVLVGANASGKSNIRDAFRFLHGIGRGYTLYSIFERRYGDFHQIEWNGIRGAPDEIVRFYEPAFSLQVSMEDITYSIEINRGDTRVYNFRVTRETLVAGQETIYTTHPGSGDPAHDQVDDRLLQIRMGASGSQEKRGDRIVVQSDQPALTQISKHANVSSSHKEIAQKVKQVFAKMRIFDWDPDQLSRYSAPNQTELGERGENLPTVLREICSDPQRKETLVEWLRELTPMDVQDLEFPTYSSSDSPGPFHLVLKEANDRRVPAYAASDGTLRFLAVLAALLGPGPERLYFFEEIDNGIHSSRVWLLIDLIERQTAKGKIQVVTTTHSPDLLTVMNDETFKNTSVVCRLEDVDDAIIRPVAELPKAEELRNSHGLGRLLTGGWMETVLAFTEGYDEEEGK